MGIKTHKELSRKSEFVSEYDHKIEETGILFSYEMNQNPCPVMLPKRPGRVYSFILAGIDPGCRVRFGFVQARGTQVEVVQSVGDDGCCTSGIVTDFSGEEKVITPARWSNSDLFVLDKDTTTGLIPALMDIAVVLEDPVTGAVIPSGSIEQTHLSYEFFDQRGIQLPEIYFMGVRK